MRERGPRVASSIKALASALVAADVHLDAEWEEPGAPTHRMTLTADQARWISRFIEGRDLDTEVEQIEGIAVTVSSRERWLIQVDGEDERVRIADLPPSVAASVSPGDIVRLEVETRSRIQPDGVLKIARVVRQVLQLTKPGERRQD